MLGGILVPLLVMDWQRTGVKGDSLKGDEDLCHVVWLGRKAGVVKIRNDKWGPPNHRKDGDWDGLLTWTEHTGSWASHS